MGPETQSVHYATQTLQADPTSMEFANYFQYFNIIKIQCNIQVMKEHPDSSWGHSSRLWFFTST